MAKDLMHILQILEHLRDDGKRFASRSGSRHGFDAGPSRVEIVMKNLRPRLRRDVAEKCSIPRNMTSLPQGVTSGHRADEDLYHAFRHAKGRRQTLRGSLIVSDSGHSNVVDGLA